MGQTSVLITTEGTYPCYPGGVSVWCDYLIRELPEVEFHLLALNHAPEQAPRFALPPNVTSCQLHSIWGTEEPGSLDHRVPENYGRKARTTALEIREKFLPHFGVAVHSFFHPEFSARRLAYALYGIHNFCRDHDYTLASKSAEAWESFLGAADRSDLKLNMEEATQCLRWVVRNLSLVALEYPRVDLVHSSISSLAGIPGVLCKLAYNSGYLLTEHGLHLRELSMSLARSPYSKSCRLFLTRFHRAIALMNYAFADQIASLGEFNRRWQIRFGANPAKLVTVPNGINPTQFFPARQVSRSRPTILAMARISPIKGIEALVRASALVRKEVPDVRVRIMGEVGDEPYYQHCRRLVEELRLGQTIEFGSTKDSAPLYREADVFCLPSLSEGMPFAVIEAMMSGCPVVASDVGSVAEMLNGHGILVRPNCPEELARGLAPLLSGSAGADLRASLATGARERALRHFTITSFAERHREMYWELTHATANLSRTAN